MKRIAIFASGAGSNANKIAEHFQANEQIEIALIICNKENAGVFNVARQHNIQSLLIDKQTISDSLAFLNILSEHKIDFIVLAGFLWLIPSYLTKAYENKIINIHPSLLPKHGGKGMYGMHVHNAVIEAKEKESGITIHYVNEKFDDGEIIKQAKCTVDETDTPETLAQKIHTLEYEHFPIVIENLLS